jgi:adenosylcobinamide-GDP ribazoletransferase
VRYLTIVPVPGGVAHGMEALGRAAPWFPVVGLALGAVLAGVERVAGGLFPPLLAAALTVTAWKALTGGLHLDGLADCLDGLAGRDAEQRLRIMRDTRLGVFGAVGLVLFLLLETAAVAGLPPSARTRALLVLPALGRATPALLARCFRPARADGHGAAFRDGLGAGAALLALALAAALALAVLGGVSGSLVVVVSVAAAFSLAFFMAARLGGVTGDVLGAAIEVAELAGLLAVSVWARARP